MTAEKSPAPRIQHHNYSFNQERTAMRIHFNDTKFVRHLGKQLTREVRSWGDEIYLKEATLIISRAFGYESYDELQELVVLVFRQN